MWVVAVILIRAAQEGFFGGGRFDLVLTLLGIGLVVLLGIFAWDRSAQRRAAEREEREAVPDEVDPFAEGYPVPPLPGQTLVEPGAGRRLEQASAVPASTTTTDDPEESRG